MKWQPHDYQKRAIKFMLSQACGALFLDPGLGKTSITYAVFKILKEKHYIENMLVVAPLRPAQSTWPKEAAKWDEFNELSVCVLHGPNKEKLLKEKHDVYIINPEGLKWLLGYRSHSGEKVRGAAHGVRKFDVLITDESTRFKCIRSLRFKILKPHLSSFARRYILTGSPAPNGLLDLFGQIYLLDQGASLGAYITKYRNTYFNATGFGGFTYQIKPDGEARIHEAIKPLVLRMEVKDYISLPPLIGVDPPLIIDVDLPEEAREQYLQMEALLFAELDRGIVTAANAASACMKCRQIANGAIYDEHGKTHQVHDAKIEATVDLVEELQGKPCLIAYEFKHDLERLLKVFPEASFLGGGVTTKKALEVEQAWNAGAIQVLLVQPQSIAHGLNLQGVGAELIIFSQLWDLEIYEQLIRRLWRQGQKERVVVHHIVAKGTIDETILSVLAKKDKVQRSLLHALKDYASKKFDDRYGPDPLDGAFKVYKEKSALVSRCSKIRS